jgi:hypothetical protein
MLGDEGATGEVLDKRLIDGRALELEVIEVLGERQLGDGELVLIERACFSLISAMSRSPTTFFSRVEYCDNLIFGRRRRWIISANVCLTPIERSASRTKSPSSSVIKSPSNIGANCKPRSRT